MLTIESTLQLTARLIGLAAVLQTLELLALRGALSDGGIWRFATLSAELEQLPYPLRVLSRALLPYPRVVGLLVLQLALAGFALLCGASWLVLPLTLSVLLLLVRFRGSFNGGSDSMLLIGLVCLSIATLGASHAWAARLGLGYLAAQSVMSYFVAGVIKLKEPSWRSGRALSALVGLPKYGAPARVRSLIDKRPLARAGAWLVMLFEVSSPLALLSTRCCLTYLGLALIFHLANAAILGLNRFVFAWAAAYPSLVYLSQFGPLSPKP